MARKKTTRRQSRKKPNPKTGSSGSSSCQRRSHDRLNNTDDPNAHFHKALNHNDAGEVDAGQFKYMIKNLQALNANPGTEAKDGFQLRRNSAEGIRNFVNPQAGWATDSQLSDPCCFEIPVPPSLNSEYAAAEAIEDYWMALLRDIPFTDWENHRDVADAAAELSEYPLYVNADHPNGDPNVDAPFQCIPLNYKSVFRGGELLRFSNPSAGISEAVGPFISQFLLREIPYGTLRIDQKFIHAIPGIEYMTDWAEWLKVQNGEARDASQNLIGESQACQRRFMSTMRDLATYVHFDQLYQAYLNAALILLGNDYPLNQGIPYGARCAPNGNGQAPCSTYARQVDDYCKTNGIEPPCRNLYPDQDGFGTLGGPHVLSLVTEVATRALKAVWRQKWTLLRLRPEAYAGLVERALGSEQEPYHGFSRKVHHMLSHSEADPAHPGWTSWLPVAVGRKCSVTHGVPRRLSHASRLWCRARNGCRCLRHGFESVLQRRCPILKSRSSLGVWRSACFLHRLRCLPYDGRVRIEQTGGQHCRGT